MANYFKPWIDDANASIDNVIPGEPYESDSQRQNGFQSGQAASSRRVNTALREATVVASALVNLLGDSANNFSALTSSEDVQNAFAAYFGQAVVGMRYDSTTSSLIISFKNGGSQTVPINSESNVYIVTQNTTMVEIIAEISNERAMIMIAYVLSSQKYYSLPLIYSDLSAFGHEYAIFGGIYEDNGTKTLISIRIDENGWQPATFSTIPAISAGFNINITGSGGEYEFYAKCNVENFGYGLHHFKKFRYANATIDDTATSNFDIHATNASTIIPISLNVMDLDSDSGDVYTSSGTKFSSSDFGEHAHQEAHLESDLSITFF